jgi:hypothetical protein
MNSQSRYEMSNNIVCFAPLSSFTQQTSDATAYQQVNVCFLGKKVLFLILDMLLSNQ